MGVRETSLSAYRSLDLQHSESELMRLVHLHYPYPAQFTRKELGERVRWTINRICGRVNSLVEKGYLEEHEQTRDGGHLLSIAQPKAAPAPHVGESAIPRTAPPFVTAPPVAASFVDGVFLNAGEVITHRQMRLDKNGESMCEEVFIGRAE